MINKVLFVPGESSKLESNINRVIEELNKENYKVTSIVPTTGGVILALNNDVPSVGYTKKALVDETSNLATPKQINYIKQLLAKTGQEKDLDGLTKRQAGILIGSLKKQLKGYTKKEEPEDNFKPSFDMDNLESILDGED